MAKKDYFKYHLKIGEKVIERGITPDLVRLEITKQKTFPGCRLKQVGRRTTPEAAEKWLNKGGKRKYKKDKGIPKPRIICICGSTKFAELHAIKRWEFEKDGKAICLTINFLPSEYVEEMGWKNTDHLGEESGYAETLNELHLRKIDLADLVYVINLYGYIGEDTKKEIEYAKSKNKAIEYMEEVK